MKKTLNFMYLEVLIKNAILSHAEWISASNVTQNMQYRTPQIAPMRLWKRKVLPK